MENNLKQKIVMETKSGNENKLIEIVKKEVDMELNLKAITNNSNAPFSTH